MNESNDKSKDENTDDSRDDDNAVSVSDDLLPEDLVPSEDNPLAEGMPDGETVGDLLNEGKPADGAEEKESDDDEPGEHQAGRASSEESDD